MGFGLKIASLFACAAALVSGVRALQASAITFTTVDDPLGTNGTTATGVSGGTAVGWYLDSSSQEHGFIYDGTIYTTLDEPLADNRTRAQSIEGNVVVGWYVNSTPRKQGFRFDGSTWTTLNDPLAPGTNGTAAYGVSGSKIAGYYAGSIRPNGFIFDGSTYTTLDDPLGSSGGGTQLYGISGSNLIGAYLLHGTDSNFPERYHGFRYDGATFTDLNDPLAASTTVPHGIFGSSIVGNYWDSSHVSHGFIYDGSAYSTVDDPLGTAGTSVNGVSVDQIVGSYTDSTGVSHGFIATIPEPGCLVIVCLGIMSRWRKLRPRAS